MVSLFKYSSTLMKSADFSLAGYIPQVENKKPAKKRVLK